MHMDEIAEQANVAGVHAGGAIPQAAMKVYTKVLHEYHDEATQAAPVRLALS